MRIKPRHNPEVNQWWICDAGRFGYEFIDQNRIERPAIRGTSGLQTVEWKTALEAAANTLTEALESGGPDTVGVILSPQLSNEDLLLAKELFVERLKLKNLALQNPWEAEGPEDDFLRRADRNPNTRGAKDIGFSGDAGELLEKVSAGHIKVLYVFWHSFESEEARNLLENAEAAIIFHGVNWNPTVELAQVVLPGVTHAEKDGTFTNFEGRIQRFRQALLPVGEAMQDNEILSRLAVKLGHEISSSPPEETFLQWRGIPYEKLGEFGVLESGESRAQS
jgi:NADH-quinone oxidoreductase subunit G